MLGRCSAAVAGAALVVAAAAAAQPSTQEVVLPGPVPYPTVSPPLVGFGPAAPPATRYVFHIASTQHVKVGLDDGGKPIAVNVLERLAVRGRGDYQFAITGPIDDVTRAPGSDSEPGLRTNQVLWVGFSAGKKVLAADVKLRPRGAAPYLPVRLRLQREDSGVTLSLVNATSTPVLEYTGHVRPRQCARLLDQTRKSALRGVRVTPAHATFTGAVGQREPRPSVAAPIRVEGELSVPGSAPVLFSGTLGDGAALGLRVHADGNGKPHIVLHAWPVAPRRQLRPRGASTWVAAVKRRRLPADLLLRRLQETRLQLVRLDQYETYLANPDADGRNQIVYEYKTAASAPSRPVAPAEKHDSGGGVLVVLLVLGASVAGAGAALVAWAHS